MTDPRSEAIRAMGEVIAAQAAHIENLEAGHWSKHTRKRVERTKRQLDQITSGDGMIEDCNATRQAARIRIPEEGMFDKGGDLRCPAYLWDDRCSLPAGHGQNHHFPDFAPRNGDPVKPDNIICWCTWMDGKPHEDPNHPCTQHHPEPSE